MAEPYTPLSLRIAFARLRGACPATARELLRRAGSEERFFSLGERELGLLLGGRTPISSGSYREGLLREAQLEENFVRAHDIRTLYFTDPAYPQRLLECPDAPLMLYGLGPADLNAPAVVSIVGTRHATAYGVGQVQELVQELASSLAVKPLIVSGLAHGIDVAAHRAALDAGLPTAGVVAHGLNTIYPAVHRPVAAKMVKEGGLVLTEYTSSVAIHRGNFLARNRIVAGVADVVVVAESAEKGGAMVTARLAREYDREVWAVPGRAHDTYSLGCNALVAKNIASLLDRPSRLIDAMSWPRCQSRSALEPPPLPLALGPDEQAIHDCLQQHGDCRLDALALHTAMPMARVRSTVTALEFKGLVTTFPGGLVRLG